VNNYNKIGFVTPFDEWSKEPSMSEFIKDVLNSDGLKKRRIYDKNKLSCLLSTSQTNKNFPLWRILNLELWIKSYGITNL
jgi:asparagine synthase (glutamine-hydrolysing)